MDRVSRRFCSAVLIWLCGCASPPPPAPAVDPVKVAQDAKCAELTTHPENCDFAGEVMMVITPISLPTGDKKKDKHNPNVLAGTCKVEASSMVKACEDVVITVHNPALIGESPRAAPLKGINFLVGGLPRGKYSVRAESAAYRTRVEMREVPSGARLKVQIISPWR